MLSCNKKVKKVKFPKSCKKPTLYGGASKANLFFPAVADSGCLFKTKQNNCMERSRLNRGCVECIFSNILKEWQ